MRDWAGLDGGAVRLDDPHRQSLCGEPVGEVVGVEHADERCGGGGPVAQSVLDLGAEPGTEDGLDRDDQAGEQHGEERDDRHHGAEPEGRGAQVGVARTHAAPRSTASR